MGEPPLWLMGVKNTVRNGMGAYGCERQYTEWYGSLPRPPTSPVHTPAYLGITPTDSGLGLDHPHRLPDWARVTPTDSWFGPGSPPQTPGLGLDYPHRLPDWARDLALGWARLEMDTQNR